MKRFVVLILILIGFSNSIAIADGDMLSNIYSDQTVESASCPVHASDVPAHESTSHSHQCHVGHCAFVVSEISDFFASPFDNVYQGFDTATYIGSFHADLFKPPIL